MKDFNIPSGISGVWTCIIKSIYREIIHLRFYIKIYRINNVRLRYYVNVANLDIPTNKNL